MDECSFVCFVKYLFKVFPFLVARTAEEPFVLFELSTADFELRTADELLAVFAL